MKRLVYLLLFVVLPLCGMLGCGADSVLNLKESDLFGKSVRGVTEDLYIESPQGTGSERGKYTSGSLEIGFGGGSTSASGTLGHSQLQSSHHSINERSGNRDAANGVNGVNGRGEELLADLRNSDLAYNQTHAYLSGQSGIYAGDDGYQIVNRGETYLKGGIITSSKAAEDSGQNLFVTETLRLEELENQSQSHGFGVQLSGSYNTGNDGNAQSSFNAGQSVERHKESGITHAGVNTRNLVILDKEGQEKLTGKPLAETLSAANIGVWTDDAANHSGAVNTSLKGEQGLYQLVRDTEIAHQFDQTRQQVGQDIHRRQDKLKAQYESGQISEAQYREQQQQLDNASLFVESLGAALASDGSAAGVAGAALSPKMANLIGQHYKELALKNPDGQLTASQKAEQALVHSLLAGAVAQANGGNALSTALAAGSSEFAASIVSQALYGTPDPQNLNARQKADLINLMRGLGAVSGATGGVENIAPGAQAAGNAVDNNYLTPLQLAIIKEEEKKCGGDKDCLNALTEQARALSKQQDYEYVEALKLAQQGDDSALKSIQGMIDQDTDKATVIAQIKHVLPNAGERQLDLIYEQLLGRTQEDLKLAQDNVESEPMAEFFANAASIIVGGWEASPAIIGLPKQLPKEVTLPSVKTFEQARNKAFKLIDEVAPMGATEPMIGTLKSSKGFGKTIGRQSIDGKVRWRLDYDKIKGMHINVEDFRLGKGVSKARKYSIPIENTTESEFINFLKQLNR